MVKEITFITTNLGKVAEFRHVLEPKIKVKHLNIEYKELRSDDPEEISRMAAKQLADSMGCPVVVEDSGLFIKALKDFPGTCSAYIHKRIGLPGILKLIEGVKDRSATYKSAIGYCEPGKDAHSFLGEESGKIADSIRGNFGFGHDPIFIPSGQTKTLGELENYKELKKFRREAIKKLLDFLK